LTFCMDYSTHAFGIRTTDRQPVVAAVVGAKTSG
jgi:hypothetical protein